MCAGPKPVQLLLLASPAAKVCDMSKELPSTSQSLTVSCVYSCVSLIDDAASSPHAVCCVPHQAKPPNRWQQDGACGSRHCTHGRFVGCTDFSGRWRGPRGVCVC